MPFKDGSFVLELAGVAATTGGAVGSVLNPELEQVFIVECCIFFTTQSTAAANLNVGIGTTATTDANNLISALAAGSTTGKAYSGLAKTANVELPVWDADEYLTVTCDSTTAGLVAKLVIKYRHV